MEAVLMREPEVRDNMDHRDSELRGEGRREVAAGPRRVHSDSDIRSDGQREETAGLERVKTIGRAPSATTTGRDTLVVEGYQ